MSSFLWTSPNCLLFKGELDQTPPFTSVLLLLKVQTPLQGYTSVHFSNPMRVLTPALIIVEFAVHMSGQHIFTYQMYIQKKIDHLLAKDRCPTMRVILLDCLQQSKGCPFRDPLLYDDMNIQIRCIFKLTAMLVSQALWSYTFNFRSTSVNLVHKFLRWAFFLQIHPMSHEKGKVEGCIHTKSDSALKACRAVQRLCV